MKIKTPTRALPTTTYSSDQFTWEGNSGVAECSDLEPPPHDGFFVVSTKTGARMEFRYFRTSYDNDEAVSWHYDSGDFFITIFND